MFSKAEVKIFLSSSPNVGPNDLVKGQVEVRAKKDFFLNEIKIEFSGRLTTEIDELVEEVYYQNNRRRVRTRIITHSDNHFLFRDGIDLGETLDNPSVQKGETRSFPFEFIFPSVVNCRTCGHTTRLPSTNANSSNSECRVIVDYSLTAFVDPDSTFGKERVSARLAFSQPGDENLLINLEGLDGCRDFLVWKGKIKNFVDLNYESYGTIPENNDEKGSKTPLVESECIPNPLDESHNHTRSIRKLFNSHYKKENYSKLVGDVKLKFEIVPNKRVLYTTEDIRDSFSLMIRSRIPNLRPNYLLYCDKSSQLGLFSLRGIRINVITTYAVKANTQYRNFSVSKNIFSKKYGHELTFDLVNFLPNYQDATQLEWQVPIDEKLIPDEVDMNARGIVPNYLSGCNVLDVTHVLHMTLLVAEDLEEDPKAVEFRYDIKVM